MNKYEAAAIKDMLYSKDLKKFVVEHTKSARLRHAWHTDMSGFREVVKPMHVFKKVHTKKHSTDCIANLIIPIGAIIYLGQNAYDALDMDYVKMCPTMYKDSRKMRASEATVHSIFTMRQGRPIEIAVSGWDHKFEYRAGIPVRPSRAFCVEPYQCESGIHFFINLADAMDW